MQLQLCEQKGTTLQVSEQLLSILGRAIMRLIGAFAIAFLAILIGLYSRPAFAAGTLPLNDFLGQVEAGNDQYKSHQSGEAAGELRSREYKLLYLPNLVGEYQNYHDEREPNNPQFQGFKTEAQSYSLGIQQNFGIGLDAALMYKYVDTTVSGASLAVFPQPHYINASPVLELNQSLWRNFLGSETEARKDLSSGSALALKYSESFGRSMLKANAEASYWRLATSRKLVIASQENMKRAERIQSWAARRSRMQLSDRSDFLQANATVAARKIELQNAIDEERSAARAFNEMRGSLEDTVPETLDTLEPEQIAQLALPPRQGVREDILAAEQEARAAKANSLLSEEQAKPDVSIYASLSLNGRDSKGKEAVDESWKSDQPFNVIGVRMNVPLSFGVASDVRAGYRAQAKSAEESFKRKAFEGEKGYRELSQRFEDSKKRLLLAHEMEKAQRSKIDYERERFGKGRTTTYQVILFEQDFTSAQVTRFNLERYILEVYAQLKTYGERK